MRKRKVLVGDGRKSILVDKLGARTRGTCVHRVEAATVKVARYLAQAAQCPAPEHLQPTPREIWWDPGEEGATICIRAVAGAVSPAKVRIGT